MVEQNTKKRMGTVADDRLGPEINSKNKAHKVSKVLKTTYNRLKILVNIVVIHYLEKIPSEYFRPRELEKQASKQKV